LIANGTERDNPIAQAERETLKKADFIEK